MDRRKNNKGVKGNQGGRKPKADEISLIENMDATKAPVEIWQKLAKKVDEEDVQAIKTWLQYRYGMPKQLTEVDIKSIEVNFED